MNLNFGRRQNANSGDCASGTCHCCRQQQLITKFVVRVYVVSSIILAAIVAFIIVYKFLNASQ